MIKNQDQKTLPALILMFGTTEKNYRPIERDAVVIGRARGCDIGLDSPDVSALHCMIWRGAAGLQIRDCGSRSGTRINGDSVQEAMLHDGDILQIGPFSFRVYLPPVVSPHQAKEKRLKHVEKSRRNLGRLAVGLRHKIRDMARLMEISGSARSLDEKASGLRQRVRDYEQRAKQLEEEERDLSRDRDLLEKERAQQLGQSKQLEDALKARERELQTLTEQERTRIQQAEQNIARRLAEGEAALKRREEEFEKRRVEQEKKGAQALSERERTRIQLAEKDIARKLAEGEAELRRRNEQFQQRCAAEEKQAAQALAEERTRIQQAGQDVERRLAEGEAELRRREEEFQQRCATEEKKAPNEHEQARIQQAEQDVARRLSEREAELRRREEQFQERCAAEEQRLKAVAQAQEDAIMKVKNLAKEDFEREAKEQAEAGVRDQRAELARMMADLRSMHELVRQQQSTDVQSMIEENAELRRRIDELEKAPAAASPDDEELLKKLSELDADNQILRQLLEEKETAPSSGVEQKLRKELEEVKAENHLFQQLLDEKANAPSPAANGDMHKELHDLKADNQLLRQLLEEKETVLEELRNKAEAEPTPSELVDIDTFEADLHKYRRQLEADREKLNVEIQSVRDRNAELDEATREMEMEMSRERADLARERTRLERLRDEVKADLERMQRDGGVRESLAGVQRLRDEMNSRRQSVPTPARTPTDADLNDRLRTFRNRLSE